MFGLSEKVIEDINNVFKKYDKIQEVYVFGSRSKGNYKQGSDIDLAINGKDISFSDLMNIMADIEDLNLLYKVDILDYNKKKNTPIGEHIDRVKQIFYRKDTI